MGAATSTSPTTASSAITNVLPAAGVAASAHVSFCFSALLSNAKTTSTTNCATRVTVVTHRSKSPRLLQHSLTLDRSAGKVEDWLRTKTAVSVPGQGTAPTPFWDSTSVAYLDQTHTMLHLLCQRHLAVPDVGGYTHLWLSLLMHSVLSC